MAPEEDLVDLNEADVAGLTPLPHLNDLSIAGPVNVTGAGDTPSRRKIFSCRPSATQPELACAKKILSQLMRQAYRRPVTDSDLRRHHESLPERPEPEQISRAESAWHSRPFWRALSLSSGLNVRQRMRSRASRIASRIWL